MSTKEERDKDPYMWRMVRTTHSQTDDWTSEGKLARKWNVKGQVIDLSNSHGLCYQVKHEDGTWAWYDPCELEFTDNGIDRARNKLVNAKFAGKTIREVDATAVNSWDFSFTDGTKISLEVDAVIPSMGLYGIGISEPGWDPKETMGPGRKPGDARKELARYDWDDESHSG